MPLQKPTMQQTFKEFVSIKELQEDVYETCNKPEPMGNALPFAYGGCAFASAIIAAYETLPTNRRFHLYSTTGYYLGPGLIDHKVQCEIQRIRDTRTFATRCIEISQDLGSNGKRRMMIMTADFQTSEPALVEYSDRPSKAYAGADEQLPSDELYQSYIADGKILQQDFDRWKGSFELVWRHFEQRPCKEGFCAQTLEGAAKRLETDQDHLPIPNRTSADWFRARSEIEDEAHHLAALIFVLDGGLGYLPLTHTHQFFEDSSVCGSLDFALRFFNNSINMNEWHLREMKTIAAAGGRTYSEARLWNGNGTMVASMTQQCILRPPKDSKI